MSAGVSAERLRGKTVRGVLFSLLAGASWGFSGTVGQYLFTEKQMDSGWLTVVRMLASGVILLAAAALRRPKSLRLVWQSRRDAARLILFALLGLMAVQYTYMQAIRHSNAGVATALQYLGEALILLVACVSARRLPRRSEVLGLALALAGVFLLSTHGSLHAMALSPSGLLWGLAASVSLMLYTLLPAGIIRKYGSQAVTGYAMVIGGLVLALALRIWRVRVTLDAAAALGVAAVVLIGTVLGFSIYLQSVADIGGVRAGLLASTETIAALLFSALWLHTEFAPADWVGVFCMAVMVVLLALPELRSARSAPEP